MKNISLKRLFFASLIVGVISLIWMIVNEFMLIDIYWSMVFWQKIKPGDERAISVALGMIFSGIYHVVALITLFQYVRYVKSMKRIIWLIIGLGVLSVIILVGSTGLLHDIGNEYGVFEGVPGEWNVLFAVHIVHALFYILSLGFIISGISRLSDMEKDIYKRDERIFLLAHYVGFITSLLGLGLTVLNITMKINPDLIRYGLPLMTIVILLPYGLMVVYWISINLNKSVENWYDEKQWQDLGKSALITGISIFPIGMAYYFITFWSKQAMAGITWFPLMLFFCLMIFSGVNLVLAKR